MVKKPITKNIISALAIVVSSFILLNVTFILDYLFHGLIEIIAGFLFPKVVRHDISLPWYPFLIHFLFAVFIALISILVFRSRLGSFQKATFLTIPVAVFLVTLGIFFYQSPLFIYLIGSFSIITTLYYFHQKKLPWLYSYSVILIALLLLIFNLTGGEI